jgi:protein-tyrosine phosphatase
MLGGMSIDQDRHLAFEGLFNVRDLGGYRSADGRHTRWHTLYRADGLNRAEGADLARLADLGLRTVIDLRTPDERVERGSFPVDALPVDYHHLPVLQHTWEGHEFEPDVDGVAFLVDRYTEMLEVGADAIASALHLLADPRLAPAVFHCAAGKDRTGVLAALVLGLLGVDDETIAADYGLSRVGMLAMIDWLRATRPEVADAMVDQPGPMLECPPEAMFGLLARLRDTHGSIEGYAWSIGLSGQTIDQLRDTLLEG